MHSFIVLAAADVNPYVLVILEHLLSVVVSLLLLGAVPLVHVVATAVRKKTGIEITAAEEELVVRAIQKGIGAGEELGRKKLKTGERPDGAKKMDAAIQVVEAELKRLGLPEKAKSEIETLIEAHLGLTR